MATAPGIKKIKQNFFKIVVDNNKPMVYLYY